jgi:hypothetical protein
MSGSADAGDDGEQSRLQRIVQMAKVAGASIVVPMVQSYIRDEVVSLVRNHEPEELREYILVQYPLVEEEVPEGVKNGLRQLGPQFSQQIQSYVTPENVLTWLDNPEEHIDADDEEYDRIKRCGEIIRGTPRGEQWLQAQVLAVWALCGLTDGGQPR